MPKSRQLTAHQVHAIRQHRQDGDTIAAIAVAYSRDIRTIADLLAGRTYQHVPENILSRELPGQAKRDRDLEQERLKLEQERLKLETHLEVARRIQERQPLT